MTKGQIVLAYRSKAGMTQQELADATGLSRGIIARLESGAVVRATSGYKVAAYFEKSHGLTARDKTILIGGG